MAGRIITRQPEPRSLEDRVLVLDDHALLGLDETHELPYPVLAQDLPHPQAAENGGKVEQNLTVTIRGAGEVSRATSYWLGRPFAVQRRGDAVLVPLPQLDEGDVLLLE
jgi:hypothetical protein